MTNSTISVPIPTSQFIELADFLREQGSDRDPVAVIQNAINYWMENASSKQEDLMPEIFTGNEDKGYSWKEIFLPHATSIRMKYKGEYSYAKVDGDNLIYEGKVVSPSEFANKVADSSRNAWRDLEIKRPGDSAWISADHLRISTKKLFQEMGLQ